MVEHQDLIVKSLGPCRIESPMGPLLAARRRRYCNVDEDDRVLFDDTASALIARGVPADHVPGFEPAGPWRKIDFDPSETRAGVNCGNVGSKFTSFTTAELPWPH